MKDDGIVKKTQETIQEKVVPAAKEGLETAQELLGRGASLVGEMTKTVRKDAGKVLEKTGDKILSTKNDAMAHFRKTSEEVKEQAAKTAKKAEKTALETAKNLKQMRPGEDKRRHGKVVKTAAGVAVLAAAAAGAYAYYKSRKDREEAIKAEFSEKMKKWNEMDGEELADAGRETPVKMHVRPTSIYRIGQNALLGEDIVIRLIQPGEEMTEFNPDEIGASLNPVEEIRKKAEKAMGSAGETAKRVAGTVGDKAKDVAGTVSVKAKDVAETVSVKAKDVYSKAADKADELKDKIGEKRQDMQQENDNYEGDIIQPNTEGLEQMNRHNTDHIEEAYEAMSQTDQSGQTAGSVGSHQHDHTSAGESRDIIQPNTEGLEQLNLHTTEHIEEAQDAVGGESGQSKDNNLFENKMESGENDPPAEDFVVSGADLNDEEISWQEEGSFDESLIMQKTEMLRQKTAEGFYTIKEKLLDAKDYLQERMNRMKPEEEEEGAEEFYSEELEVTIHNRGNKDYFFSPMLIQRYNSRKRVTAPVPTHEEGTTLEQRIIKPGETYTGTIVLKKTEADDAIIMFEDMLMKSSVAILLTEEPDYLFLEDESYDMQDDLLFEGIDGDLEDYEFGDDEEIELDPDDLEIDEPEEITIDISEEETK